MEPPPATKRCLNCDHDVSTSTFPLHEAFCLRNVKVCPRCKATVMVQSLEEHLEGCGSEETTPTTRLGEDSFPSDAPPTTPPTSCTVCREMVPLGKMEEHVSENHLEIPCDMCEASFPFSRLQDHIKQFHTCEYCQEIVPSGDLREHQENCCSMATRKCRYCDLTFNNLDYAQHVEACGSRTELCEGCMSYVMLREMDDHTTSCWQHGQGPLEPFLPEVGGQSRRRHRRCCCCCPCTLL